MTCTPPVIEASAEVPLCYNSFAAQRVINVIEGEATRLLNFARKVILKLVKDSFTVWCDIM